MKILRSERSGLQNRRNHFYDLQLSACYWRGETVRSMNLNGVIKTIRWRLSGGNKFSNNIPGKMIISAA